MSIIAHIDLVWESCLGCVLASKPYHYEIMFHTGNIKFLSKRKLPQPKNVRGGVSYIRYRFLVNPLLEAIPTVTFLQTQEGTNTKKRLTFQYRNGVFE